jgi:hypothetical protein
VPIDPTTIVPLLSEEEGPALDFKREQYRFHDGSDDDKSELLKDILAFVNAWRRTDAYILIGVAERRGGAAAVVGITEHLADGELQQFVNSKTDRPVIFSYRTAEIDGAQIGVVHIPVQDRPAFLKKKFGKVQASAVYVRRGSATAIAKPDEVFRMGLTVPTVALEVPEINIRFANIATRTFIDGIQIQSMILDAGDPRQLPDFHQGQATEELNARMGLRNNLAYWRELAWFAIAQNAYRPIHLAITNRSGVVAVDVRAELSVSNTNARLLDARDYPIERPKPVLTSNNNEASATQTSSIRVTNLADQYLVEIAVGKIQPQATVWLNDPFYIGSESSGEIRLGGVVTADNLPAPQQAALVLQCRTQHRQFTFEDVQKLEQERFMTQEGRAIAEGFKILRQKRGG